MSSRRVTFTAPKPNYDDRDETSSVISEDLYVVSPPRDTVSSVLVLSSVRQVHGVVHSKMPSPEDRRLTQQELEALDTARSSRLDTDRSSSRCETARSFITRPDTAMSGASEVRSPTST